MIWVKALVALALLCLPAQARVGLIGGPSIVQLSTKGVVANGSTDNTAALNALPANATTLFHCDTGPSNTIKATGELLLQSNLHLDLNLGAGACPLSLPFDDGNQNHALITQASFRATPPTPALLTGVSISGGIFDCTDNTHTSRLFYANINSFSWTGSTFINCQNMAVFAGSNFEIGPITITNPNLGNGPGFRWVGYTSLAASTNKPTILGVGCNGWFHDISGASGDGLVQDSPQKSTDLLGSINSDNGFCFDNITGVSNTTGPLVLVGDGAAAGTYSAVIGPWAARNITGPCGNGCITISGSIDGGVTAAAGTIQFCTLDASADTSPSASIFVRGLNVSGPSLDQCNVTGANLFTMEIADSVSGTRLTNSTFGAPRNCTTGNLFLRDDANTSIIGNTIAAGACDAILVGPTGHFSQSPTIQSNILTGIPNLNWGVQMVNVDGATVGGASAPLGNTITPAGGTTTSKGILFSDAAGAGNPGTTNTIADFNDPSAVTGTKVSFTLNGGTTNKACSNTGAPDHNCP